MQTSLGVRLCLPFAVAVRGEQFLWHTWFFPCMSWWLVDRQLFYSPVTDSRDFGGTEMLVGAGVCYFPSGHLGFGKTLVSHALVKWFVLGQASLCTKCSGIISESLYPPSTYWKQERAFL